MMKAEQAFETAWIGLLIYDRLINNVLGMNNIYIYIFFFTVKKNGCWATNTGDWTGSVS
jgi:hypothetical protein